MSSGVYQEAARGFCHHGSAVYSWPFPGSESLEMHLILVMILGAALLGGCNTAPATPSNTAADVADTAMMKEATVADPYLWLEEVEGERALAWVRQQNERSLDAIRRHAVFESNLAAAMDLATSLERIPYGSIRDGSVYNFWQDDTNVRGLWRRTPLASYESSDPDWETVLDFDKLAEREGKNWVFKGADCLKRRGKRTTRCMVSLSDGGKDAIIRREFDLDTKTFVNGGFVTTEAKQGGAWIDRDTMLIATDWGSDGSTLTESGYPSSVRLWQRGQNLEDAKELYAGQKTDVGVWPWSTELESGEIIYGAVEADTFFTTAYWLLHDGAARQLPIPPKSSPGDIYEGFQFVTLQQDWTIEDQGTDVPERRPRCFRTAEVPRQRGTAAR